MIQSHRTRGFTLIELMVVITIIGLLASTIFASLGSARAKARDSQRLAQARELMKALEIYRTKNGIYPVSGPSTANTLVGGDASNAIRVVRVIGGVDTTIDNAFHRDLPFTRSSDSAGSSLLYRVRNVGSNVADTSAYTILIGFEDAPVASIPLTFESVQMNYCKIVSGVDDTQTTLGTPVTAISAIPKCAITGIQ